MELLNDHRQSRERNTRSRVVISLFLFSSSHCLSFLKRFSFFFLVAELWRWALSFDLETLQFDGFQLPRYLLVRVNTFCGWEMPPFKRHMVLFLLTSFYFCLRCLGYLSNSQANSFQLSEPCS